MHPVLFETTFGVDSSISFGAYRFFGLTAAFYLLGAAWFYLRAHKLAHLKIAAIAAALVAAFLTGSRLLYALLYPQVITANPALLIKIHLSNFTLYGGLAAALLTWWLAARTLDLPLYKLTDRLAPHAGIAVALIRIGCYLGGCCFGIPTGLPWGITFPTGSPAHLAQAANNPLALLYPTAPVHPTQLYELASALGAALVAWLLLRKKVKEGLAGAVFGLVFTTGRLITFQFRDFPFAEGYSNLIRGPLVYGAAIAVFLIWTYKVLEPGVRQKAGLPEKIRSKQPAVYKTDQI